MRCAHCGKNLPDEAFFCAYCGAVVQTPPAALSPPALNPRALAVFLAGAAAGAPLAIAFWLIAGQLLQIPLGRRLALGLVLGGLAAAMSALLEGQVLWPLAWRAPISGHQLAAVYGLGGALTILPGAVFIGALVLADAWGTPAPDMPILLTGAATGGFAIIFALPPAMLLGWLAGQGLGLLAARLPALRASASVLAWHISASVAGGVVGAFVASQSNFSLPAGAYLGALAQSLLAALLLPVAPRLLRGWLILAR